MELWLTCAENDEVASDSIVLGISLVQSMTNRKKTVLIGSSVSDSMRRRLENVFEGVIRIEKRGTRFEALDFNLFAKMYMWSLPFVKKCIFIDSSIFVIRNCDDFFDQHGNIATLTTSDGNDGKTKIPILSICPSLEIFENISKMTVFAEETNMEVIGTHLYKYLSKKNGFSNIDKKLLLSYDGSRKIPCKMNISDVRLVHFVGGNPGTFLNPSKSLEDERVFENLKAVTEYWQGLHTNGMLISGQCYNMPLRSTLQPKNEPIAIVGMSCRFPGANNISEFWNLLINGEDAIKKVPEDRWTPEQCCANHNEFRKVEAGFLKCPIDQFDGGFFGMSPRELSFTDPQHRFLLEVGWEALEDAAIDPTSLQGSRTAIFTGIWRNDYGDLMTGNGYPAQEFRAYMGNGIGVAGGRLAHVLGVTGSNIVAESACSSSMVAVGLACKSLRRNESDMALVCAVNLLLNPFTHDNFKSIVSPRGRCRTFDADADGFARAEGCAVLVLKRLSQAVRDEDRIYAIVRGYGEVQEGLSSNLGTPTVAGECSAMKLALEDGNVDPMDVTYLEAHGTGTKVGDPIEWDAISQTYYKGRTEPLAVGSVKTNVGHTESVAGIAGIIKTILALNKEVIPPHRNLQTLNPLIDLQKIPAHIPLTPFAWKKNDLKLRTAGINSFGITGTDAHLIIQEAPKTQKVLVNEEKLPCYVLTLSTKSEQALTELISNYEDNLQQDSINLSSVAFTANTGRGHFNHRVAIVGKNCEEILKKIKSSSIDRSIVSGKPKLCFLYTGQGSQHHGMGKTLYRFSPIFRNHFDQCDKILADQYGISIRESLWGTEGHKLKESLYSQTSIFCIEYALTKLWESWGITPDCVLGHSLGEFAASVAAGMLKLEDALKLVAERSRLINKLEPGRMLVVRVNKARVEKHIELFTSLNKGHWIDVAAVNSEDQTTVAGPPDSIEKFEAFCSKADLKTHLLEATHAFHSRDMIPILKEYENVAKSTKFSGTKMGCEYVSGVEGIRIDRVDAQYWVKHTRNGVLFKRGSEYVYEKCGARIFLEIGPNPILLALTRMNLNTTEEVKYFTSMKRSADEWETIMNSLAKMYTSGFKINWKEFHSYHQKEKVPLPFYPFQRKKHWFEPKNNSSDVRFAATQGNNLHPLIGRLLSNATKHSIFESFIDINGKDHYVKDHMLGKYVLFPAGGYLEMCAAAGLYSTGTRDAFKPIGIKNFVIKAPLNMKEQKLCTLQTVVSKSDAGEKTISIYSCERGNSELDYNWKCYATAEVSQTVSTLPGEKFHLNESKKKLNEAKTDDLYQKLSKLGYNFGPAFCSIKRVWQNESLKEILCEINVPEETLASTFLTHPVAIDAMIQTQAFCEKTLESLYVPISVSQFMWISKTTFTSNTSYVHTTTGENQEKTSTLYDDQGKILAVLKGLQFVETSMKKLERKLETSTIYPPMYIEEWRTVETSPCVELNTSLINDNLQKLQPVDSNKEVYMQELEILNTVNCLGILKSLREMGCTESVGEYLSVSKLLNEQKIRSNFKQLLERFLEILYEDGYLSKKDTTNFTIVKQFPTPIELEELMVNYSAHIRLLKSEMDLSNLCLGNLTRILQGELSPLPIIFSGVDAGISGDYYNKAETNVQLNKILGETCEHLFETFKENKSGRVLQILEIGAGTGSTTKELLPRLKKHGIIYRYTFTDISAAFFNNAKTQFGEFTEFLDFQTLNIEEDPLTQGFAPFKYDVIIASQVLHATKNLVETCENARTLLKTFGVIIMAEMFTPQRFLDTTFGLLEGFWRFTDFRKAYCLADDTTWKNVLKKSGFGITKVFKISERGVIISEAVRPSVQNVIAPKSNRQWLIISSGIEKEIGEALRVKLEYCGRTAVHVQGEIEKWNDVVSFKSTPIEGVIYISKDEYPYNADQTNVCKHFLNLIQSVLASTKLPKVFVITEGQVSVRDQEPRRPSGGAALWAFARTLRSENSMLYCKCIDMDPNNFVDKESINQVFNELWIDDKEYQVAYRMGSFRHLARLCVIETSADKGLKIPKGRYTGKLPDSKRVADLIFESLENPQKLIGNEIEVQVKCSGMNFLDVFTVMKPVADFSTKNTLGADFTGVVTAVGPDVVSTKIGDSVMGINHWSAMPSHIVLPEDMAIKMPNDMTFAEGATLPVAFTTAYLCMVAEDQLKSGETVLIHTGSGAVGIILIQMAQHIGAKIIATAGSYRKRAFLRSKGITHVFNSRDLEFGEKIKNLFPNGIDVVINSLTSPGFKETSLSLLNTFGRFIEMSLINIWTEEEIRRIRPDVKYCTVHITLTPELVGRSKFLLKKFGEYLDAKIVQPVPHSRFYAENVREAWTYLKNAEHIGKVVCIMPELNVGEHRFNLFNERSTYLITGGLGGIGIELANWMVQFGAKYIVLCSRSSTENTSNILENLKSDGANVVIMQADVGNYDQCKSLVESISTLPFPPLKGVMHAAGALSDALVTNQTWETFKIALNAKVHGSWNLHVLTLDYNLEHFVFFSSMVATLGTCGQSNHASANAYMDALAHYRHNLGLCATTINWGQWGEIGVAANIKIQGVSTFTPTEAFNALEYAMSRNKVQLHVGKMNVTEWKSNFPWTKNYLQELKDSSQMIESVQMSSSQLNASHLSSKFWQELDKTTLTSKDRRQIIGNEVASIVSTLLQIDYNELEWNKNFQEMGLDSLMNIDLSNVVKNMLGKRVKLSMTSLADCNTISLMTDRLIELIYHNNEVDKVNSRIARRKMIHEDSILPEHIRACNITRKPSEIKTVLITGVTGNLGPYILENISNRNQIQKIYCLVRDKRNWKDGTTRLIECLREKGIFERTVMSKVEVVNGNVSEERLGMDKSVYEKLAECVDAVIHIAVKANHLEEYRKTEGNVSDVRTVNVEGTKKVLEFVTSNRTKWLFHASSLIAVMKCENDNKSSTADQTQRMPETWPHPNEFDESANMGYAISKFIADRLIAQAVEDRSIPAKIFRFPIVSGDRITGHQSISDNHFVIRYLYYVKSGVIPKLDIPMVILPVNDCADIALDIFFKDEAPVGLYNVFNPHSQREEDIVHLGKEYGKELSLVDYPEFVKKLVEDGENSMLYLLQEFYTDEDRFLKLLSEMTLLEAWRQNREVFFQSRKCLQYADKKLMERLEKPLDILRRDLNFALKSGFFSLE